MRILVVALLFGINMAHAQTEPPAFEVASIKPNRSVSGNSSTHTSKGQLNMENHSLKRLIERAYSVRDFSFSGPGWLDTERFDIVAKPPAGTPPEQFLPMLQTLLKERFKVAVHREKKTVAGYALVQTKRDLKLEAADDTGTSSTSMGRGRMEAKTISMAKLADMLGRQLDQPVEDMTELTGNYNLKLEWTPDEGPTEKGAEIPAGPTLFTALQEQLGLQLRAQKVTIDVLVVDRAEKQPTEN
jgi:uncharacterized protein (TIGR03435 family)